MVAAVPLQMGPGHARRTPLIPVVLWGLAPCSSIPKSKRAAWGQLC